MVKQVDKSHYVFSEYVNKVRWASIWHQIDEVNKLKPKKILEIGPGPGIFKATAIALGMNVETLDIDPELKPDYVDSVFKMPFRSGTYDVVCAFQMLEHLPFEKSLNAFSEMDRVAARALVISLPDSRKSLRIAINLPRLGLRWIHIPELRFRAREHKFDGEHFWEINKLNYSLDKIIEYFNKCTNKKLVRTFRVNENPYHRFFVWESSPIK